MPTFLTPEQKRARREEYPDGALVRAVNFVPGSIDDNETVPPGTLGVAGHMDDAGTINVAWQNGATLGVLVEDTIELVERKAGVGEELQGDERLEAPASNHGASERRRGPQS